MFLGGNRFPLVLLTVEAPELLTFASTCDTIRIFQSQSV